MNIPILKTISTKTNEEHNIFICSDLHFGCDGQNISKLKSDFDKAVKQNAMIIIVGDWGEFIIPQDKKRYTSSRDILKNDNQLLDTVELAYSFLKDYANNILMIGTGNHEATISKFHSFDPTQSLIFRLRREAGAKELYHGQYSGFIRLSFGRGKDGNSNKQKYDIFYTHGQGGGATPNGSVTMLKAHMYNKQADFYTMGHSHAPVVIPSETMMHLNSAGNIKVKKRVGVLTGCYSGVNPDIYDAMVSGYRPEYGEEKMRNLQGEGGAMLTLTYLDDRIDSKVTV